MVRLRAASLSWALAIAATSACSDPPKSTTLEGRISGCPMPAGRLTLYAIPATQRLDWTTPKTLFTTLVASDWAGSDLTQPGLAAIAHYMGHVDLEMDCGAGSIPLTSMTSDDSGNQVMTDGFGVVFRDFPGVLTEMPGPDHDDMVSDVALREASGLVTRISFLINAPMCSRLKSFHDAYIAHGAHQHYSGLFRARRFEGAGCAIFGAGMVDVGGLLRRSLFTEPWSQTTFVGSARFANFGGSSPFYNYGSNSVARDDAGVDWVWPRGVNIPASTTTKVDIGGPLADAWFGPEDPSFGIDSLPNELKSKVPFSIYDPQKMVDWAEAVWHDATAHGTATSLGATWTAGTVQAAHEVTYDAVCVMPQTIAFDADNDDLFKDSDAP